MPQQRDTSWLFWQNVLSLGSLKFPRLEEWMDGWVEAKPIFRRIIPRRIENESVEIHAKSGRNS